MRIIEAVFAENLIELRITVINKSSTVFSLITLKCSKNNSSKAVFGVLSSLSLSY